jgi:hypothetical protein
MDVERLCALDIDPPDQGMIQRRVIEVTIDGDPVWREFDIVQVFEDEQAARAFAAARGLDDVDLEGE